MATYLQGNLEMQGEAEGGGGDGLQTLVLMNPGYLQYSETTAPPPPSSNLLLLNSMAAAQSHQHQFVGIPLNPIQQHSMAMHPQSQSQSQDVSVVHGFLPRMAAPPTPRALSLTLSNGEDHHAPPSGVTATSKYLKAAQELLDEAVHVNNLPTKPPTPTNGDQCSPPPSSADASAKPADRQDIQMKKAKLINMLDQVEQRYRQYQQQMHLVISSFEQAAGIGSATTYTSLALHTISKQFRCLKDAITAHIRGANQSLGEEDCLTPKLEGSRLKYVDHHLRQHRALQHLGMIQHNAWRPQRGLPERSVSVLRAWLFEHFLHPYPKDSDKHMLAKQTGLTRSQVSNWFINARVRLWKPMVEEMYMEEMKECHDDKSSKSSEDPSTKKGPAPAASETDAKSTINSKQDVSCASNHNNNPTIASVISPSPSGAGGNVRNQFGFSFMGSSELEGITQASPKKPRNHDMMPPSPTSINMDVKPNEISNEQVSLKFGDDQRQGRDGYSFMENQTNFMGAFGQYPIGEIGRFDAAQHFAPRFSGNGVSLTLGLPHCDTLSGSHHQTFLPNHNNIQLGRRLEMGEANEFGGINPSTTPHSSAAAAFENINMQNPKRFVAQLLPDFVT